MNFTDKQWEAVTYYGKDTLVSAGAGSGKTAVLSERVRYFVCEKNFKITQFLILTFTELASKEMKERIRKKLAEAQSDQTEAVDQAFITTFDAFALQLVKRYHLTLGLNASLSLVSGAVMDVRIRNAITESFHRFYENQTEPFLAMVREYCFKTDQALQDFLFSIVRKADLFYDKEHYFTDLKKTYTTEVLASVSKKAYDVWQQKKDNLYLCLADLTGEYQKKVQAFFEPLFASKSIHQAQQWMKEKKRFPASPRELDEDDSSAMENMKQVRDDVYQFFGYFFEGEEGDLTFKRMDNFTEFLIDQAQKIYHQQQQFKWENQVFEFSDIAFFALDLVYKNAAIRSQLQEQFAMIMVDEYQDTSEVQEKFLQAIARQNLYMVGDVKQSIYRFRHADATIFSTKYRIFKTGMEGHLIDLNTNFRSRKEVLADINTIFSALMNDKIGGANYRQDHQIEYGNKTYLQACSPKNNYHVETIAYEQGTRSAMEEEAHRIANDILCRRQQEKVFCMKTGTVQAMRFSDVCILMDRGTSFSLFKRIFESYQIPVAIEQNTSMRRDVLTLLLKNICTLLLCLKQKDTSSIAWRKAYFSVARSFLYQETDAVLYRVQREKTWKSLPLYADLCLLLEKQSVYTMEELYRCILETMEFHYKLIRIGDIQYREAILDALYAVVQEMDVLHYRLEDFVQYLGEIETYGFDLTLPSLQTNQDAVKLMNIHKSKGLEFPFVYYAGLYKRFNLRDMQANFQVSFPYLLFPTGESKKTLFHYFAKEQEEMAIVSEQIRLFYVALTRAKEKMIFVYPKKESSIQSIQSCRSFLDFLQAIGFSAPEIKDEIFSMEPPLQTMASEELPYLSGRFGAMDKDSKPTIASKTTLSLLSSSALTYGSHLHFLLQHVDFITKDTTFIVSKKERMWIDRFLTSPLLEDTQQAIIYKEFAFYDEVQEVHGVIDCFIKKAEGIVLLDYKLKHLEDEAYQRQIKTYAVYLKRMFQCPVRCYLYSIIEGKQQEVLFEG